MKMCLVKMNNGMIGIALHSNECPLSSEEFALKEIGFSVSRSARNKNMLLVLPRGFSEFDTDEEGVVVDMYCAEVATEDWVKRPLFRKEEKIAGPGIRCQSLSEADLLALSRSGFHFDMRVAGDGFYGYFAAYRISP